MERLIVPDPEILGGSPVFIGTRVPVRVLFENLEDGLSLDEILDAYPTIKKEHAIEVLRQANSLVERTALIRAATHNRSLEDEAREIPRNALNAGAVASPLLGDAIHTLFAPLSGFDLPPMERESMREPLRFDA